MPLQVDRHYSYFFRIPLQIMSSQQGTIWTVEVKMIDYGFLSQQQNHAFPERLVWNGTERAANHGHAISQAL